MDFYSSRYFIGLQALLGSRMILRLREDFGPISDNLRTTLHDPLGSRMTTHEMRFAPFQTDDLDYLDTTPTLHLHPLDDVVLTRNNSKSSFDRWIPLHPLSPPLQS
jgi:hypothetical protein